MVNNKHYILLEYISSAKGHDGNMDADVQSYEGNRGQRMKGFVVDSQSSKKCYDSKMKRTNTEAYARRELRSTGRPGNKGGICALIN